MRKNTLQPSTLQIVSVGIDDLHPAEYNPRTWNDTQMDRVADSIRIHGFVDPVIVNGATHRKNTIIGGHLRWHAARKLKHKTVPVVYVDIPDIEQEKSLNLRLNRSTGEWDYEKLKNFDIALLENVGFDDGDFNRIFGDSLETEDDGFDVDEELKNIVEPKTKIGDLYQLGSHVLLCGDSTKSDDVRRVMGKERADMVYCDPIYNIGLSYDAGLSNKKTYGGKTKDDKSDEEYSTFLQSTLANALEVSKPDAHVFYWCDPAYIGLLQRLYAEKSVVFRRLALWVKNNQNVTPNVAFNRCFEPVVYGTRGKPYLSDAALNITEVMNKEIGNGNRLIDDVLDLLDIWMCKRLATSEYEHPTSKPPTLHEKPLRRCTRPGDVILDLFGGSGSTLIACEQMKRRCFMVEIEPIFCDLIIRRFEALSGIKASLFTP